MTTDGTDIEANRHYRTMNVQRRVWRAIYNSGNFSCNLLSNVSRAFNHLSYERYLSWKEPANTEFLEIADQLQACFTQTTTRPTTEP